MLNIRTRSSMTAKRRPHLLFIGLDQLRYDCVGYAGLAPVHTPHIDRLARQGLWFSHAFTPIPTCCPARQSLLSGQWPETHGGLWNYDNFLPVPPFVAPTWTEALRASGYQMAYIGKWHAHPTKTPIDFGYETYRDADDYDAWRIDQGLPDYETEGGRWLGGLDPAPTAASRTHWLADHAIDQLTTFARHSQPWHLRLDLVEPHLPCHPTQAFLDLYDPATIAPWGNYPDALETKPYAQRQLKLTWGIEDYTWDDWVPLVHRYWAIISQIDDAVGRVLAHLDALGVAGDTVVIFTSDHGDACGSHGLIDKHFTMYDEIVRVPLIVRWPGHVAPGSQCDAFVNHALDLAALCWTWATGAVPASVQGRSLGSLLQGQTPDDWRTAAFATYNGQQFGLYNQRMIRTRRWKYIWNLTDVDELYDLAADPYERINSIAEPGHAEVLQTLRLHLLDHLERRADPILKRPFIRPQLAEGKKINQRYL